MNLTRLFAGIMVFLFSMAIIFLAPDMFESYATEWVQQLMLYIMIFSTAIIVWGAIE